MNRHFAAKLIATACMVGFLTGIAAQAESEKGPLTELSLEDLLSVKVTSVSKRSQSISQSAAAIFVISQDDIRRSGRTTIPELLRLAPGVDVAQIDASHGPLGFAATTVVWSNKLLVCSTSLLEALRSWSGRFSQE